MLGNKKNNMFRLQSRFFSALIILVLLLFISACANNAEDATEVGSSQKATNGTTLYLKITDNGKLVRSLAQDATVSVVATLKSPSNEAIEGQVIRFSTGVGSLAAQTGLTNSSGQAIVSLSSGAIPQAGEITAAVDVDGAELAVSYGFEVGGVATTQPNLSSTPASQSNDGAIEFVSAVPQQITLKSVGGIGQSELSTVTFRLVGTDGLPLVGQTVDFSINNRVGGISLEPASAETAVDGTVSTIVQSGTVPTSVVVTALATVGEGANATEILTVSSSLAVGVGLPDQDSMSLSFSNLAPEAWSIDGEEVDVTIRLADHFNNFVVDGTTVYFVAEGGGIEPSCETVDSACTVKWVGQNPRPENHRASILATTIGSESFKYADSNGVYNVVDGEPFTDINRNGVFDAGDTYTDLDGNSAFNAPGFVDLGESFLDANENGVRDIGEFFIDSNVNGEYDLVGDEKYNGVLCDAASNVCSDDVTAQISTSGVLVMAGSFADYTIRNADTGEVYKSTILEGAATNSALVAVDEITRLIISYSDSAGQVMPEGTTILVTTSAGQLIGYVPTEVQRRSIGDGINSFAVLIKDTDTAPDAVESGVLNVVFTTLKGSVTIISLDVEI